MAIKDIWNAQIRNFTSNLLCYQKKLEKFISASQLVAKKTQNPERFWLQNNHMTVRNTKGYKGKQKK